MKTEIDRPYVIVTWCDAHAVTHGWTDIEELDVEECLVESIGVLLVGAKSGHIVLAQSMITGEDTVDNVLAIPEGMVKVIHRVSCGDRLSLP